MEERPPSTRCGSDTGRGFDALNRREKRGARRHSGPKDVCIFVYAMRPCSLAVDERSRTDSRAEDGQNSQRSYFVCLMFDREPMYKEGED